MLDQLAALFQLRVVCAKLLPDLFNRNFLFGRQLIASDRFRDAYYIECVGRGVFVLFVDAIGLSIKLLDGGLQV